MNETAQLLVVVGLVLLSFVLSGSSVWFAARRRKARIAAAGDAGNRVRLDLERRGYARGLVPVIEDLLDRVEVLEREVDELRALPHR